MGQCVLRDLGFEFEKDPEKRRMLDEYLREKIKAKYPQAQSVPRLEDDIEEETPPRIVESIREKEREKSPRFSRQTSRATTQVEKCCQTELNDDDSFTRSRSKLGDSSRQGSKLMSQYSNEKLEITPKTDILKDYRNKSNNFSSATGAEHNRSEEKNIQTTSKKNASTPNAKQKSDINPLVESKVSSKRSLFASKENMFDGIERIDFNSPMSNNIPSTTNRSRKFRGFENKYFRPTRGRSPSPMTEDANIFDDDEDGGYDDDMH
jgi:DNA polymerase III alpha subunit (gram-positive type)